MRKVMIVFSLLIMILFFSLNVSKAHNEKVIYLDPGHGGIDGGASIDGVIEAKLNLEIALKLKAIFSEHGYQVLLTRDGDYDLATDPNNRKRTDIRKRVSLINNSAAIFYLSIHMNTYTSSIYSGAQTFYNKNNNNSFLLANNIQDSLTNYLKNTTRKAKNLENVYLVENTNKPGCLIECGFLSNAVELKNLCDDAYQLKVAQAIYYGCVNYLNVN